MHNNAASTVVLVLFLSACASPWKIHGGPKECTQMCSSWGMQLTGMVGVGNQDRTGYGATACVCELPRPAAPAPGAVSSGAVGMATGTAAVVVALEEARRQEEQQQQQLQRTRR
jgi:hypothetical protein